MWTRVAATFLVWVAAVAASGCDAGSGGQTAKTPATPKPPVQFKGQDSGYVGEGK